MLQAGLVYRAIETNMRMLRWEHALELAAKHNAHVDTVLLHRQQYLRSMQRQECDVPTRTRIIHNQIDRRQPCSTSAAMRRASLPHLRPRYSLFPAVVTTTQYRSRRHSKRPLSSARA